MTAVAGMPGRWPGESNELLYPRINTQVAPEPSLRVSTTPQPDMSPRSGHDELFFDCHTLALSLGVNGNGESSTPSYLVFEPVVESVAKEAPTDWRRYEPPQELLHLAENTSEEIQRLLGPSIERIKARYAEEEESRVAHARAERPLGRVGRASVKPLRREPLMNGALRPLSTLSDERPSSSRLSAGSATSLMSIDSGYASHSPSPSTESSTLSPSTPSKGKGRAFGFHSIFGRRNRSVVNFDGLYDESSSSTLAGEVSIPVPSTPLPVTATNTEECVSCLDDFEPTEMIPLACHSYCTECFSRLIITALESETHWPAKCCLNTIPSTNILPHITSAMKTKYLLREAEWSIPAGDRIYCSKATCSAWIPPKSISTTSHTAKCPTCSHKTCTTCRGTSHGSSDCPSDPALLATNRLAELEGWKRCYQCHALVEHNNGCRHMTCRCKAQFCYICTLKWRTCTCTDAQLADIQTRAQVQRTQVAAETARQGQERAEREAREARERRAREAAAEEERINLQLVADFIAAEQERERVALEALRAQEEAERLAREEERRLAEERRLESVSARFRLLGSEMEALHNIQRVLLSERYEFESNRLQQTLEDELAVLDVKHPGEIAALTTSSAATIASASQAFIDEYHLRLAEERRIEDAYVSELRAFWAGKPDGEYKVREARDELRRDQEREYKFWDGYRKMQLQGIRGAEERKMESLRVRQRAERGEAVGRAGIDEVVWRKGMVAEGRWVEAVVAERIVILGDEERRMYDGEV